MKIPTYVQASQMQLLLDLLLQQMQICLSDDGFVIPSQTTAAIDRIVDPDNPSPKGAGTIWYDTTLGQFVGNQNGTLVSFNTTPI